MKLSFSTLGCPDWNLARIAERAKHYGFDGVELRIGGDKHIDPALCADERNGVKRLFAEAGIGIASVSGYTQFAGLDDPTLDQQRHNLCCNIDLARDIGAPYVRTFIGEGDGGRVSPYGVQVLRQAGERAIEQGVMVLIETHDALSAGKQVKVLLDAVNSAGVGILWDMAHTVRAGESPSETYGLLGASIKHVHMKDAAADFSLCLPGEGALPMAEVAGVLARHGYDGYLSFEWEKMWAPHLAEPEVAFPQYVAYMRSL
ncbi:MAG: sugar phosphate isomerase/epimerase [Clostridia bacterium]|nr:sugar phosphate isomerase/epimerase [Clostridia bacterium]